MDIENKSQNLNVKEFNYEMLDDCKHTPSILLASARGGGKSVMLHSLMQYADKRWKFSHIFAFSQTDRITNSLPFMKQENIFSNLDTLAYILETRMDSKVPSKDLKPICLIFNDIASLRENNRSIKNSESLEKICSCGRHRSIMVIILVQKLTMVNPLIRLNMDCTFLWVAKSHSVKQRIKEEYLGLCKNKKESEILYDQIFNGTPYNAMAVLQFKQGITAVCGDDGYVYKFIAPFPVPKWKSKSLKKDKTKTNKNNKKLEIEKNNIFNVYNEIKTNPTLRRSNRIGKKT